MRDCEQAIHRNLSRDLVSITTRDRITIISIDTGSQVTSLQWSNHYSEIVSSSSHALVHAVHLQTRMRNIAQRSPSPVLQA
jgi:hypothetical protein